jgi:hypothetical protein
MYAYISLSVDYQYPMTVAMQSLNIAYLLRIDASNHPTRLDFIQYSLQHVNSLKSNGNYMYHLF